MRRQPRQRPVSCHFCRDPPRVTAPASRSVAKRGGPPPAAPASTPANREADILSRLEKLESLLAGKDKESEFNARPTSTAPSSVGGSDIASRSQPEPLQPLPLNVQNLTADALWLERTCLGPKPSESVLVDNVVFRICTIRSITQPSSYIFQNSSGPSGLLSLEPTRCIWLPQRHETKVLVNKYTTVITYMHHIIHTPSVFKLVDEVYDSIEKGEDIPLYSVFLILAICCNITYAWTVTDNSMTPLFSDFSEANSQAFGWLKAAFDVFDASQRRAEAGLESAQGLIIMSFVLLNVEGVSIRARNCFSQAITICRELGVHRLDYPHNPPSVQATHFSNLQAETARRVWWYLIGTDAMIARFPGPHEGTYLLNPLHMDVRKPLNANDEDLVEGKELVGQPITHPTNMSYFLQRVRLAEVIRGFVDRAPLYTPSNQEKNTYDIVLEIDSMIERFIDELPVFLKIEAKELRELPLEDVRRAPGIIVQRHIMKIFVYGQRCKLHLPYLARGAVEPAYARSRRVCLDSARIVIQAEHQLEGEHAAFDSTRLRLCLVLHSVFIASIVLLLDLCLGVDADEKEQRRHDLVDAWDILEAAKEYSRPTARIQGLLRQVMKKHKVTLPISKASKQHPTTSTGYENLPPTPNSATVMMSASTTPTDVPVSAQELSDLGLNMDLDGLDWENLLWGLEAPMF
ncbi:zinc finger transcription factor YRR1 [Fusarium heterosporum]|uniref:Zinc finger transcription factor YRR1 n=1 Tax=Fusarium heterosporum TaxID=42747 RepID=A0A8H5WPN9_FUSHE|nr:zinc finger transcription factor YRR1 [Fusarium heterosporum]